MRTFINDYQKQDCFAKTMLLRDNREPLQIQMFGIPSIDYNAYQGIYSQLKLFEQALLINQSATQQLLKKVDGVSNHLNEINMIISKKKIFANESQIVDTLSEKLVKEDPFLETKLTLDTNIIDKVFGNHKYKYQICLSEVFDRVIFKERNFKLKIKLVNGSGETVSNSNRIPISFNAYYDQQNPQLIETTRLKVPIFKGNNEAEMHQGEGSLSKLQFKEVSSFYSNNGIFFIMYAKPQSFKYNNSNSVNSSDKNINYHLIRPLVIKDIIVKAKKK